MHVPLTTSSQCGRLSKKCIPICLSCAHATMQLQCIASQLAFCDCLENMPTWYEIPTASITRAVRCQSETSIFSSKSLTFMPLYSTHTDEEDAQLLSLRITCLLCSNDVQRGGSEALRCLIKGSGCAQKRYIVTSATKG